MSLDLVDVAEHFGLRANSPVSTEVLVVHYGTQWHGVEHLLTQLEQVLRVLLSELLVEVEVLVQLL